MNLNKNKKWTTSTSQQRWRRRPPPPPPPQQQQLLRATNTHKHTRTHTLIQNVSSKSLPQKQSHDRLKHTQKDKRNLFTKKQFVQTSASGFPNPNEGIRGHPWAPVLMLLKNLCLLLVLALLDTHHNFSFLANLFDHALVIHNGDGVHKQNAIRFFWPWLKTTVKYFLIKCFLKLKPVNHGNILQQLPEIFWLDFAWQGVWW